MLCRVKSYYEYLTQKYTKEYVESRIHEHNPLIDIIGTYIDTQTNVLSRCNECGNEWMGNPSRLMRGHHCPKCALSNRDNSKSGGNAKSNEEFLKELSTKNPTVVALSPYINARTKIDCKCSICGYEYKAKPSNLLTGFACAICSKKNGGLKQRKTNDAFLREMMERNPFVIPLDEYNGNTGKILVECAKCGFQWYAMPVNLIRSDGKATGCPQCQHSHGEEYISRWLDDNDIAYIPYCKFNGLVGIKGRPLSYDFFLPNHNILIEYQGEFHDGTATIQTDAGYLSQIEHDNRKRQYAKDNGYKLIEIWYYDNKEEKLNSILHDITNPVTTTVT